jgi:hypothetical protein
LLAIIAYNELIVSPPPVPNRAACCLFLDIDGTLLDFAPTPHEVRIDEALRNLRGTLLARGILLARPLN